MSESSESPSVESSEGSETAAQKPRRSSARSDKPRETDSRSSGNGKKAAPTNGQSKGRPKTASTSESSAEKVASTTETKPAAKPVAKPVAKAVAKPVAKPVAKATSGKSNGKSSPPADTTSKVELPEEVLEGDDKTRGGVFSNSPSWLTSLVIHMLVILGLAVWTLPDLPQITANLLLAEPSDNEDLDDLQNMPDLALEPMEMETEPVEFELQPDTEVISEEVSLSTFNDESAAPSFTDLSEFALNSASNSLLTDAVGFDGTGTTGRGKRARSSLVRKHGGSAASETAVALALDWLAEHQNPDGSWSLIHDGHRCQGRCDHAAELGADKVKAYRDSRISGTGLALLPYLGAGQTHKEGKHRKVVERGLKALMQLAKEGKQGASWADSGNMYAHGIAAICLTEAYGMTEDPILRAPAQAAVDYIVYAQDPKGGGWRYRAQQRGDTSVTGWQIMALKSAYLSELSVPTGTVTKAAAYLNRMSPDGGIRYIYALDDGAEKADLKNTSTTRSAIGLLCQMYLGWKSDNPKLKEGVEMLAKKGPSENNFYYNYYGSQVLFQYTGGRGVLWRDWNKKLRDQLVLQQAKSGHAKGSWYVKGPHSERGGRLYITSLAAMNLEVYYRYMPIYGTDAVTNEFPQ